MAKLRIISLFIAVILSAVSLCCCDRIERMEEETENAVASTETLETKDPKNSAVIKDDFESAITAYADFLRSYESSCSYGDPTFLLAYINEDTIPELLMIDGTSHVEGVNVYIYSRGDVSLVGNYGQFGEMLYAPKMNLIQSIYSNFGCTQYSFYCIQNSMENEIVYLGDNEKGTFSEIVYLIDEQAVSKAEYEAALEKAKMGCTFVLIGYEDGHVVNEENISAMLDDISNVMASDSAL